MEMDAKEKTDLGSKISPRRTRGQRKKADVVQTVDSTLHTSKNQLGDEVVPSKSEVKPLPENLGSKIPGLSASDLKTLRKKQK